MYPVSFNFHSNPTRAIVIVPILLRENPGLRKERRPLKATQRAAAKPRLEPRSASLQSPNSVHKSCQLPGRLGFTERSLGMGLLIFGSDEGFNKLQDVYVTNGLLFLSGGISFGRTKGTSGSEADDETQLTFYTEQYRSRRRSKGKGGPWEGSTTSICRRKAWESDSVLSYKPQLFFDLVPMRLTQPGIPNPG